MIEKGKLKWTKEDDEAVRKFKKEIAEGKTKTVHITLEYLKSLRKKPLSEDEWI